MDCFVCVELWDLVWLVWVLCVEGDVDVVVGVDLVIVVEWFFLLWCIVELCVCGYDVGCDVVGWDFELVDMCVGIGEFVWDVEIVDWVVD